MPKREKLSESLVSRECQNRFNCYNWNDFGILVKLIPIWCQIPMENRRKNSFLIVASSLGSKKRNFFYGTYVGHFLSAALRPFEYLLIIERFIHYKRLLKVIIHMIISLFLAERRTEHICFISFILLLFSDISIVIRPLSKDIRVTLEINLKNGLFSICC